jgi:hypothetical protein
MLPGSAVAGDASVQVRQAGPFTTFQAALKPRPTRELDVKLVRQIGDAPPVAVGGPAHAAVQPSPDAYGAAGVWAFTVPKDEASTGKSWLQIDYKGDVARLFDADEMLDDRFWDGRRWDIAVDRFSERIGRPWEIAILPIRADAPIYLDGTARAQIGNHQQSACVMSVKLAPEYELKIGFSGNKSTARKANWDR